MRKVQLLIAFALLTGQVVKAQKIALEQSSVAAHEDVVVSYSGMPANVVINLYQDAALLPLKASVKLSEAEGDWHIGEVLEPGRYKVLAETASGEHLDSVSLVVRDMDFVKDPFTILLVSDVHVMHPDLLISDGEAFAAALRSDRKMMAESARAFDALIDTALLYKPQVLLISGDLTKDGEKISHEYVAEGLARLKEAGIQPLVIPGNHDVSNPHAGAYDGDTKQKVESVTPQDFANIYAPYGYDETLFVRDTASLSFVAEPTQGLCIMGIDASQYYDNKSKAAGDAVDARVDAGRLKPSTLQWILDRADEAAAADKRMIAMMHYQIAEHFDSETSMMPTALLADADTIAPLLMKHGIHLMMTGHVHISDIAVGYNKEHTDSIIDIATGSTITYPAHYRWLQLRNGFADLDVNTRMIRSIKDVDDYTLYGRKHFEEHVPMLMSAYIRGYSDVIFDIMQSMQTYPYVSKLIDVMPSTADGMADWLEQYMMTPLVISYVTHSEGNEHLKKVELVEQLVYDTYDKMIDDLTKEGFSKTEIFIYKTELKKVIIGMMISPVSSLLYNSVEYGTPYARTTNDLYLKTKIGEPVKVDALEQLQADKATDDAWYDVLGRRFRNRPAEGGIYIHNGQKVRL